MGWLRSTGGLRRRDGGTVRKLARFIIPMAQPGRMGHQQSRCVGVHSLKAPSAPTSFTPVVEMRDLTMQWGDRPVLDRVNLTMQPGQRLAVVGPSGAGKSTVLRLLAGLQLPSAGELRLFGEPQPYLRLDQRYPKDVRLVFQNPAFLNFLMMQIVLDLE